MAGSYTQRQADTLQDALEEARLKMWPLGNVYDSLNRVYSAEKDMIKRQYYSNALDSIRSLMFPLAEEQEKIEIAFVAQHPDSYVSSSTLYQLFLSSRDLNSTQAQKLYKSLSGTIQNSKDGKLINDELAKQQRNRIGSSVPEINGSDVNNKPFSFSSLAGKRVLIDFWASWCVPCRKAIPHLKELYQQYHQLGFEVVLISMDKKDGDWKKAVRDESVDSFINIIATTKMQDDFVNAQMPIPNQILVGGDGKILWNSIYEENNETIDNQLNKAFQ